MCKNRNKSNECLKADDANVHQIWLRLNVLISKLYPKLSKHITIIIAINNYCNCAFKNVFEYFFLFLFLIYL